jgi:hypothetical protein
MCGKRDMFKRILLWTFLVLSVSVAAAAYRFADWFQNEWAIYQGRRAFQSAEFAVAVKRLTPVLEKGTVFSIACWDRPDCVTYLRRAVAQSQLAEGQDDAALGHYRQLTDSTARFVQGLAAIKSGKWDEGIEHLEAAGDCEVCRAALENARIAKAGHASSGDARLAQAKALADTIPPIKCLGVVGGSAAIKYSAATVLPPPLVTVIRKAGATKRVAEEATNQLMRALRPVLSTLTDTITGDMCPPLTANETIRRVLEIETVKWLWDLDKFDLVKSDVQGAAQAISQAVALGEAIYRYGQAFNAEMTGNQQVADVEKRRSVQWAALATASAQPSFINSGIKSLRTPDVNQDPGWFASTLDAINPTKWLTK